MEEGREIKILLQHTELPASIRGFCAHPDTEYIIMINSSDPEERQAATFLHECLHIYHNDHETQKTAQHLEQERHAELMQLLELLRQEIEK